MQWLYVLGVRSYTLGESKLITPRVPIVEDMAALDFTDN